MMVVEPYLFSEVALKMNRFLSHNISSVYVKSKIIYSLIVCVIFLNCLYASAQSLLADSCLSF